MTTTVMWFRRDLRLNDHPALRAAVDDGDEVLGLFCLDPALVDPAGPLRLTQMYRNLRALDRSMGGRLVVRAGDPVVVVPELALEVDAAAVHVSADFGPYGSRRDHAVADVLTSSGIGFVRTGSPYLVEPGTILNRSGSPYRVFTPFCTSWRDRPRERPSPAPTSIRWRTADGIPIPDDPDVGGAVLPEAGEDAARARLETFRSGALDGYAARRDIPAVDATSRLSPDLRWGVLHPRQVLDGVGTSPDELRFEAEVAWREFFADVLLHQPESARESLNQAIGAIEHDEGVDADRRFEAWCWGRTGFPIVDAGMRQLMAEGWVHNRVRMIVASFLVKDLHLPWQRGARWFMRHLIDGDLASNQHGWQWTAGTGTDAAPYFRIFNPTLQGKKFDPSGEYVRRYVPELASVPDRWVHEPHLAPGGPPSGYVEPIVDHGEERDEALRRLEAARSQSRPPT